MFSQWIRPRTHPQTNFWFRTFCYKKEEKKSKRATAWQNHQNNVHPAKTVRTKKLWVLSFPLSAQERLWSDCVDVQTDLSLRWAHIILLVLSCFGSGVNYDGSAYRYVCHIKFKAKLIGQLQELCGWSSKSIHLSKKHMSQSWDYGTYCISDQRRLRHIRPVSPEPSLFSHMKYGSRRRVQPKIRHLAPLDCCACAFEEWVYGGWKVP